MPSECCGKRLESAASRTSLGIKHLSALALETTYIYLHADLKLKERAMAKTTPSGTPVQRYQPEDRVFAYLNSL